MIAVSEIVIMVGSIITDNTTITANKLCPFGNLKIFCILGTINATPKTPYNTDGIPANSSTAGEINLLIFFGATSTINVAVSIPIGAPIIREPIVAYREPNIIGSIPNLSLLGIHSVPNKNSDKEYPFTIKGVKPL
ncbi:hypothetical protein SDC9_169739 [bioreactor metagenome]|uniref:Uncharacterized protein n=1 Tax=bioreactor metagenome TaxID=1076179 RepID=A0A645G899_9ZZZZ